MSDKKTIVIGSDHNGFNLKRQLIGRLSIEGHTVIDMGPVNEEKCDYVFYASLVGHNVSTIARKKECDVVGILICGTGIGMSIMANKFQGVRAALVGDVKTAKLTREHNDSNVLVLSAWHTADFEAIDIAKTWLDTDFAEGRHMIRIASILEHENKKTMHWPAVLVPGVFDEITTGHINMLRYARGFGRVVVALSSDEMAAKVKGKAPVRSYKDRREVLKSIQYVDEVIENQEETAEMFFRHDGFYVIVKGDDNVEQVVRKRDGVPDSTKVILYPLKQ